MTLDVKW